MVAELICVQNEGTIKTAEEFGVILKTVENWVTAYNKDPHCSDDDYISTEQQMEAARKTLPLRRNQHPVMLPTKMLATLL